MRFLEDNLNNDRGASMVEYGLIVSVIALLALSAVTLVGEKTSDTFTEVAGNLEGEDSANTPGGPGNESDQNGGDQNGGDQNGGDQNGGDQNGGDQNGGDQNGGDQNGGDQNGGDQNGGDQNGENDQQGEPGEEGDSDDDDGNGGDQNQEDDEVVEEEGDAQPGPSSNPTGSSASLTWWNGNKNNGNGAWQASVGYKNETNRHQYLQVEVTRVDEKDVTTTTTIKGFYVPANGSSTFSHWDNQFSASKGGKLSGVVEVQVEVIAITTSDQDWQPFSYPVSERPVSVLPPTLK
jgi:Flp pilus assembly pilin Flp